MSIQRLLYSHRKLVFTIFLYIVTTIYLFKFPAPLHRFLPSRYPPPRFPGNPPSEDPQNPHPHLIVASLFGDDTSWIPAHITPLGWTHTIYTANDRAAPYTVPHNKGRESNVYLTYIIDHYESLPLYNIFIHAKRYQWHNDDPLYDHVPILRNLQLPNLLRKGYVNLRCVWILGCPNEVRPLTQRHPFDALTPAIGDPNSPKIATDLAYARTFSELFPDLPIPTEVGVSCCAQFSVTRAKIRSRPKADYERYRRWLLETELPDDVSGRVMEYSWHIIFGQEAVHCPDAKSCYCETFGLCGLECREEGSCEGRYRLAPFSTMPEGWPEKSRGINGWP